MALGAPVESAERAVLEALEVSVVLVALAVWVVETALPLCQPAAAAEATGRTIRSIAAARHIGTGLRRTDLEAMRVAIRWPNGSQSRVNK